MVVLRLNGLAPSIWYRKFDMKYVIDEIGEYLTYLLIIIFAFGWIDTLWIFGVENSKEYTWWYLIHVFSLTDL